MDPISATAKGMSFWTDLLEICDRSNYEAWFDEGRCSFDDTHLEMPALSLRRLRPRQI